MPSPKPAFFHFLAPSRHKTVHTVFVSANVVPHSLVLLPLFAMSASHGSASDIKVYFCLSLVSAGYRLSEPVFRCCPASMPRGHFYRNTVARSLHPEATYLHKNNKLAAQRLVNLSRPRSSSVCHLNKIGRERLHGSCARHSLISECKDHSSLSSIATRQPIPPLEAASYASV